MWSLIALEKWIESYNLDAPKFVDFALARYDPNHF